jgi:hypothetical protein
MGLGLLSRTVGEWASVSACILGLPLGVAEAFAGNSNTNRLEPHGARDAITRQQVQAMGPTGTDEPAATTAGELVPGLSTADSDTWRVRPPHNLEDLHRSHRLREDRRRVAAIENQLAPAVLEAINRVQQPTASRADVPVNRGLARLRQELTLVCARKAPRKRFQADPGNRRKLPRSFHLARCQLDTRSRWLRTM